MTESIFYVAQDLICLAYTIFFKGNDPRQYKSYKYYDFTYAATTSVSMDENNKVLHHILDKNKTE